MQTLAQTAPGFAAERLERIHAFMASYVDRGLSAGIVALVAHRGEVVFFDRYGFQELEHRTPISLDTIFRIYSMTKPITSTAIMMLCERGALRLSDAVADYIPAFRDIQVFSPDLRHRAPARPPTIRDLLTHTAGLSYGDFENPAPHELYKDAGLVLGNQDNLADWVEKIARLPLLTDPGVRWHYSVATDLLGYIVEVISRQQLGAFFAGEIFGPLGMVDTYFAVPEEKLGRVARMYGNLLGEPMQDLSEQIAGHPGEAHRHAGGGGLYSTTADYLRFAQMIANKGELDGQRLIGRKTVEIMTRNHLPAAMLPMLMGEPMPGLGFGLGFRVTLDAAATALYGSDGSHGWGGWANTVFWIDPVEEVIGILMSQYLTNDPYPIREDFYTAVYQALI